MPIRGDFSVCVKRFLTKGQKNISLRALCVFAWGISHGIHRKVSTYLHISARMFLSHEWTRIYTNAMRNVMVSRRRRRHPQKHAEQNSVFFCEFLCIPAWKIVSRRRRRICETLRLCVRKICQINIAHRTHRMTQNFCPATFFINWLYRLYRFTSCTANRFFVIALIN